MPGFYTEGPLVGTSQPPSVLDTDASMYEAATSSLGAIETATTQSLLASGQVIFEDLFSKRIPAEEARATVKRNNMEGLIEVPDGGMSQFHLDYVMWAKQRERQREMVAARSRSTGAVLAGFAGDFVLQGTDPINIASAFIPVVREARAEALLARAGTRLFQRGLQRARMGFVEGSVGAIVVEPINLLTANLRQADYGVKDSFVNIAFGGILGAGLHSVGGAIYDARMKRVLSSFDRGIRTLELRAAAEHASEETRLVGLQTATLQAATDNRTNVEPEFRADARRQLADDRTGDTETFEEYAARENLTPEEARRLRNDLDRFDAEGRPTTADPELRSLMSGEERDPNWRARLEAARAEPRGDIYVERVEVEADRPHWWKFNIYKDGEHVAHIYGTLGRGRNSNWNYRDPRPPDDHFNVSGFYGVGGRRARSLRGPAIRTVMREIAKALPDDVKYISGYRVSGARQRAGRGAAHAESPLPLRGLREMDAPDAPHAPRVTLAPLADDGHISALPDHTIAEEEAIETRQGLLDDANQQAINEDMPTEAAEINTQAAFAASQADVEPTVEDINAENADLQHYINTLRVRGIMDEEMEAQIAEGADTQQRFEGDAQAYEAAIVCDGEADL
jgi:hypothetical protein